MLDLLRPRRPSCFITFPSLWQVGAAAKGGEVCRARQDVLSIDPNLMLKCFKATSVFLEDEVFDLIQSLLYFSELAIYILSKSGELIIHVASDFSELLIYLPELMIDLVEAISDRMVHVGKGLDNVLVVL
jgi:hypothetical protein